MFEEVYRYIMAIQFHGPEEDDDDWFDKEEGSYEPNLDLNLRERELKVVVKIVDYELSENDIYDGVWHVEGMSHESSTLTCSVEDSREKGFVLLTSLVFAFHDSCDDRAVHIGPR